MWLLPSKLSSDFAVASGCWRKPCAPDSATLDSSLALRCAVSGKVTLQPASWRGWKNRAWSRALFGAAISPGLTSRRFVAWWTCSVLACPASRTAAPASSGALRTSGATATETARSRTPCDSLPSVAPPWCSSRTSLLGFAADGFDLSERNYADWVTRSKARSLSLRNRLARAIGGSGCLSWPTPYGVSGNHGPDGNEFSTAVRTWQTPRSAAGGSTSRGGDRIDEPLLGGQVKLWTTPQAHDVTKRGSGQVPTAAAGNACLAKDATQWASSPPVPAPTGPPSPSTSGRRLNAIFVSWLMGAPFWWTKAEPMPFAASEMQSYRFRLRSRLSSLLGEPEKFTNP